MNSQSTLTVISGPTELFLRAPQHDEHCRGWRWEMYLQDGEKRAANVRAETLKMIARARLADDLGYAQAAE